MKNIKKQNKGITLIVLVITIVVLIILASISIGSLLGSKGIINQSNFSVYGSKIRDYQRELEEYIATEQAINDKEDVIIYTSDKDEIKRIITSMSDEDAEKFVIQNNELKYNPDNVDDKEKDWLAELGMLAMEAIFAIVFMSGDKVYKTIYSNKVEFPTINPTSSAGGFSGWFYDEEGTTQANVGDELTENITLYAKYEETGFLATFMVDGEVYEEIRGEVLAFPTIDPSKDNVKFTGWYYDETYTKEASVGDVLVANTTLYSKWNSYITNKLDGNDIFMVSYIGEKTNTDWYYVNSKEELYNIPSNNILNIDVIKEETIGMCKYPAWVKLRLF